MKGSRKGTAPKEYVDWLSAEKEGVWVARYPFDSTAVKDAVRAALHAEQRGLCIYCGCKLDLGFPGKSYHLEHFWPQSPYQDYQVAYWNLFLSCGQEDPKNKGKPAPTCGTKKGNWFDEENHIYPSQSACTDRFRFMLDGTISPIVAGDQPALKMIEVLNLNHPELVKDRADVLVLLDAETVELSDYWDAIKGIAESYAHVAFQHLGNTLP